MRDIPLPAGGKEGERGELDLYFLDISRDLSAYAGILMMLDDSSNDRLGSRGIRQRLVILILNTNKPQPMLV